ncbi:MAG: efflux transporter outer membrane subunit [Acetobacteraceae bacterium]|nr:efflux transporter outer membrane subunit [Acetobacteraceae bacterium]
MPISLVRPALALVLLGGCSLGPAYHAPQLDLPASYRAAATEGGTWPAEDWWQGFASPELDALIADARANSPDIQAAVARVRQADAQLRLAGASLWPVVGVSASEQWARSAISRRVGSQLVPTGRYGESRSFSVGPTVSWEADLWGRLAAGREAAASAALATRFDERSVALSVVAAVASTWFQALALQDRVDVATRNLGDAERILAAITARAQAGTASQLDVSQQAALVAGVRARIPGLRSQLEQQVNALGVLTGRAPAAITVRPGTLATLALPSVAPGLPSELLARRPDVAAAEADLRGANANIKAARAAFFPSVTLSGRAGFENIALATLFGPGSLFASAVATAAQSIFDGGARSATLERNRGRYDELLANYRRAVIEAFTDVENALQAWRYSSEQEGLSREAVATSQRAADIARAQLLAGTIDLIAVLNAQNTLFSNLDTLAQVRLARFQALLALYKALGGGWSAAELAPPPA